VFHYNLTKIMCTLRGELCIFMIISRLILVRMTNVEEKINTHILCSITSSESRALYEIMWKIWYSLTDHRRQYNSAHALCMLDN
jgi:hypothetical protein